MPELEDDGTPQKPRPWGGEQEATVTPLWLFPVGILVWLLRWLARIVYRHPVMAALAAAAGLVADRFGLLGLASLLAVLGLAAAGWRTWHPASFHRAARRLWLQVRAPFFYRLRWRRATQRAGLVRHHALSNGVRAIETDDVPRIRAIRSRRGIDTLRVALLPGQSVTRWMAETEVLRSAFGARQCVVEADGLYAVRLRFDQRRDAPATAPQPAPVAAPDIGTVAATAVGATGETPTGGGDGAGTAHGGRGR
ncbi:MAG: hypothetical protein IRZ08_05510 [Frankia sp.]|nr:hypothetical protein [Frankia sp.]